MIAALLLAASGLPAGIPNPSFERGLEGWSVAGHRGIGAGIETNALRRWPEAAQGEAWLNTGWRARNAAPRDAEKSVTTLIDAHPYRGRRLRLTAMTRAPDFAEHAGRLRLRAFGPAAAPVAETRIGRSRGWRLHSLDFTVPADAVALEIGFIVQGTAAELDADDLRLEILR